MKLKDNKMSYQLIEFASNSEVQGTAACSIATAKHLKISTVSRELPYWPEYWPFEILDHSDLVYGEDLVHKTGTDVEHKEEGSCVQDSKS